MTFLRRSLLVRSRDNVYHHNPFRLPLAPYLSISISQVAYSEKLPAFYDGGDDDGIVAARVSCEGGAPRILSLGCCGRAISFCGSLGCG